MRSISSTGVVVVPVCSGTTDRHLDFNHLCSAAPNCTWVLWYPESIVPQYLRESAERAGFDLLAVGNARPSSEVLWDVITSQQNVGHAVAQWARRTGICSNHWSVSLLKALMDQGCMLQRVEDVADSMGVSVRSLRRHTGAGIGLTPQYLLGLSRALHAAVALQRSGEPLRDVGLNFGYHDAAGLLKALRRYLRLSALDVRLRAGVAPLLPHAFNRV